MLNILVASKEPKEPGGLHYLPPHRVIYSHAVPWGRAANDLIEQAARLGGDAIFCDDDVTFQLNSLGVLFKSHLLTMDFPTPLYSLADAFGFDLHDTSNTRQAGARHILQEDGSIPEWVHPGPAYVAHCSTSAIYLKESALRSGARFPEWPGIHWEDVAYCMDLWAHGCKVMAVPGLVLHDIVGGVGATKRHSAEFWQKWQHNQAAFRQWCGEHDLSKVVRGAVEV